jgi:hypothetical protein
MTLRLLNFISHTDVINFSYIITIHAKALEKSAKLHTFAVVTQPDALRKANIVISNNSLYKRKPQIIRAINEPFEPPNSVQNQSTPTTGTSRFRLNFKDNFQVCDRPTDVVNQGLTSFTTNQTSSLPGVKNA